MKILFGVMVAVLMLAGVVSAEEVSDFGNSKGFGWQERARVCTALTEQQCTLVVQLQTGGGDGSGAGGDSGAAAGDSGASSGGNGDGCGPK